MTSRIIYRNHIIVRFKSKKSARQYLELALRDKPQDELSSRILEIGPDALFGKDITVHEDKLDEIRPFVDTPEDGRWDVRLR